LYGSTTADEAIRDISLQGKTIIITGANSGIGKESARVLAKAGGYVIMACRSMDRGQAAVKEIQDQVPNAQLRLLQLDIGSLNSIRQFVHEFEQLNRRLDILLCNAGIMATPYSKTVDGFEVQFGTNHLGHFYLTNLLMPKLSEAAPNARVVVVASAAHRTQQVDFDDLSAEKMYKASAGTWKAYGQSKTANILFAVELNRRMRENNIGLAVALHPGGFASELQRNVGGIGHKIFEWSLYYLGKTIPQGAATSVYCCTAPEIQQENLGGKYFSDCNEAVPMAYATDPEIAKRLWTVSERLLV
jgi:light-dependent protochlorophyllide reductase